MKDIIATDLIKEKIGQKSSEEYNQYSESMEKQKWFDEKLRLLDELLEKTYKKGVDFLIEYWEWLYDYEEWEDIIDLREMPALKAVVEVPMDEFRTWVKSSEWDSGFTLWRTLTTDPDGIDKFWNLVTRGDKDVLYYYRIGNKFNIRMKEREHLLDEYTKHTDIIENYLQTIRDAEKETMSNNKETAEDDDGMSFFDWFVAFLIALAALYFISTQGGRPLW